MKKSEKALEAVVSRVSTLTGDGGLVISQVVRDLIELQLKKSGVTADEAYGCLKDGLRSTKTTVDKYGEEHVENDYIVRHKYMVTALELMGHLSAVKSVQEKESIAVYEKFVEEFIR